MFHRAPYPALRDSLAVYSSGFRCESCGPEHRNFQWQNTLHELQLAPGLGGMFQEYSITPDSRSDAKMKH